MRLKIGRARVNKREFDYCPCSRGFALIAMTVCVRSTNSLLRFFLLFSFSRVQIKWRKLLKALFWCIHRCQKNCKLRFKASISISLLEISIPFSLRSVPLVFKQHISLGPSMKSTEWSGQLGVLTFFSFPLFVPRLHFAVVLWATVQDFSWLHFKYGFLWFERRVSISCSASSRMSCSSASSSSYSRIFHLSLFTSGLLSLRLMWLWRLLVGLKRIWSKFWSLFI